MTTLNAEDFTRLAREVAKEVIALLDQREPPKPVFTHRLTVEQFAICIERTAPHVREKIRLRRIPKTDVDGPPYLIHPRALKIFGVSPELGATRLDLWKQAQTPSPALQPFAA